MKLVPSDLSSLLIDKLKVSEALLETEDTVQYQNSFPF